MTILSGGYALFVLASVATFWLVPRRWRAAHLAVSSLVFTAFLGPVAVAFLVAATVGAWIAGLAVADEWPRGRTIAGLSVVLSLMVFFGGKIIGALTIADNTLDSTVLPLGFSFYTFQTIAYSVEVLRGRVPVERSLVRLGAYVAFYPHLTAGPVLAPRKVLPQFGARLEGDLRADIAQGVELILLGVFKKVVLADFSLRLIVSSDLDDPAQRLTFHLMLPIVAYFDISGLLNIARGIGKFYGLNLPRSFSQPLTHGRNVTDYWRRWQIPLLSWFREYVYRPTAARLPASIAGSGAIFVTFMAAGLWHAINVVWLIWGALTALAIILDRKLQTELVHQTLTPRSRKAWRVFRRAALLVYVFGTNWITSQVIDLEGLIGAGGSGAAAPTSDVMGTALAITIALIVLDDYEHRRMLGELKVRPTVARGLAWGVAVAMIALFWNAGGFIPFTYEGF